MANTPVVVKNASDTWVNQDNPSKPYGTKARLQIRNQAGSNRQALIYFNRPFPLGVRILSAKLQVYTSNAIAGAWALQVARAATKWSANKVRYNNVPVSAGTPVVLSKTSPGANTLYEVDVTALMQAIADGTASWYGFLLKTTTGSVTGNFHSAQSDNGDCRPKMVVQWTTAPDQPDQLSPAGGRQVSVNKPVLTYNFSDPSGDDSIAAQRVQFGTSEANVNAGVATWDSGMVPTTGPEMDLNVAQSRSGIATVTAASNQLTGAAALALTALDVGSAISGTGVAVGATITAVNVAANSATMSAVATATSTSSMTLSNTHPGLTAGVNQWWRVQALDDDGNLSAWSDAVEFGKTLFGALAFTTPSDLFFYEGSPLVAWSLATQTQRAYQLWIAKALRPAEWLWDSGKVTDGAIRSDTIPFKKILEAGVAYRIGLRSWDTVQREGTPTATAYQEITADLTYNTDATVADVTGAAAASDPVYPIIHLTFARASAPSHFQILKSDDGGATWYFYADVTAAEALVAGTNYKWDDVGVESYTNYQYKIISVVGNRGSIGVIVTGQARRLAPFLMRVDGSDACCFLNPERSRQSMDIQEVHQRMSGPPVLVTQVLGGYAGKVKGRLVDEFPTGRSARAMKKSFNAMRKDSGQKMRLALADETLIVVAYNMNIDTVTDTTGITYLAEFDWIQVDD